MSETNQEAVTKFAEVLPQSLNKKPAGPIPEPGPSGHGRLPGYEILFSRGDPSRITADVP